MQNKHAYQINICANRLVFSYILESIRIIHIFCKTNQPRVLYTDVYLKYHRTRVIADIRTYNGFTVRCSCTYVVLMCPVRILIIIHKGSEHFLHATVQNLKHNRVRFSFVSVQLCVT